MFASLKEALFLHIESGLSVIVVDNYFNARRHCFS